MAQWKEKNQARPATYPAEKARQGQIVLRKPWQRVTFLAGLFVPFILAFIGWLVWLWWR